MTDITSELGLLLAEDADDNADYLTLNLADSLRVLDGLFSSATGHNHNGSHQGGALEFQDLEVGGDLLIHGVLEVEQSLRVTGATTLSGVLNVTGQVTGSAGATFAGDVITTTDMRARFFHSTDGTNGALYATNGTLYLRAPSGGVSIDQGSGLIADGRPVSAVSFQLQDTAAASRLALWRDGGNAHVLQAGASDVLRVVNVGNTVEWGDWRATGLVVRVGGIVAQAGYISAGPTLSGTSGDLSANRGANTGYVFLGNGSRYVGFDGTNYSMPGASLVVGGAIHATDALLASRRVVRHNIGAQMMIQVGSGSCPSVGANNVTVGTVTFPEPFDAPPTICMNNTTATPATATQHIQFNARNATTTGFTWDAANSIDTTSSPTTFSWIAYGQKAA
jgi:hypothetical protein